MGAVSEKVIGGRGTYPALRKRGGVLESIAGFKGVEPLSHERYQLKVSSTIRNE